MSQIRLYVDEDAVERGLVQALQNSGVNVLTTAEANRLSYPDEEQLIWATEQGRVIYSFNRRDFNRLHSTFLAEGLSHAGIILGTATALFSRQSVTWHSPIDGCQISREYDKPTGVSGLLHSG